MDDDYVDTWVTLKVSGFLINLRHTGCTKSFATFLISRISLLEKMIKSWFLFQKMHCEKLYKTLYKQIHIDLFWWLFILNMNDLHGSAVSQRNKNVSKMFLFWMYLNLREWWRLGFFPKRCAMKRSMEGSILTCSNSFFRWLKVKMFRAVLPRILKCF